MDIRSLEYPDLIDGLAHLSEEKLNNMIKDVEQARQEIKKSKLSLIKRRILFFDFDQLDELYEHVKKIKIPYVDEDDDEDEDFWS
jgi:hypothetical protein